MQRSIPILWGLVIALLILNLFLLYALNQARLTAIETLSEVETTLDDLAKEVIVYNLEVNQPVPMKADVPLDRTMEIPLKTTIPIDQILTVPFQTPTGEVTLAVPVKTDFPIDIVVPVNFNQAINVDTEVQLETTLPVEIDIAQTPLAGYLIQAKSDIAHLRNRLALQGKGTVVEKAAAVASSATERDGDTEATATGDIQSQPASVALVATKEAPKADISHLAQAGAPNPASSAADVADQPDLGLCAHDYWPLRSGTAWTYNSPKTSYTDRVDNVSNNQVYLSTQYEGQDVHFSLACSPEGLGGAYLGDMRRTTELGQLTFSSSRGVFLPSPEAMGALGRSWTQEFDVTGAVQASQGNRPVAGRVSHGRATAVYTPISFESVETPLGVREALRIEQKLELDLGIEYSLHGNTIPSTETANLTNVFWFVKGMGLVKAHWQGGTIRYNVDLDGTPVEQVQPVPALPEDQLVIVCVTSEGQSPECMHTGGVSEFDLTTPPESELEVQGFVFPTIPGGEEPGIEQPVETPGIEQPVETPGTEQPIEKPTEDNHGREALLAYAAAVESLGRELYDAAQDFWEAALKFQSGKLTFEEFQAKFVAFKPKVESLIDGINRLSPPPEAEGVHQKLTRGLAKCGKAVDLLDDWFDEPDSDTKEAATLLVTQCTGEVSDAQEELEALMNED